MTGFAEIEDINPTEPEVITPGWDGEKYESVVPDTLDLAERAALGVH